MALGLVKRSRGGPKRGWVESGCFSWWSEEKRMESCGPPWALRFH